MDLTLHLLCPGRIRPLRDSAGEYSIQVPKHPRVSLQAIGLEIQEKLSEKVRTIRIQVVKDGELLSCTSFRRIDEEKWLPISNDSRCIVEASGSGTTLHIVVYDGATGERLYLKQWEVVMRVQ